MSKKILIRQHEMIIEAVVKSCFVFKSPLELTEESMIGEGVFREDCLSHVFYGELRSGQIDYA